MFFAQGGTVCRRGELPELPAGNHKEECCMQVNRPTDQQIRQRAYEIFVQSGRKPGYEVDNWLQAEYELMQLPVRKIAELEPPKAKPGKVGKLSLVSFVQAALFLGASAVPH